VFALAKGLLDQYGLESKALLLLLWFENVRIFCALSY
jgi:hypothetical protein